MKGVKKIELPVLEDVVIPGKEVPESKQLPPILTELQEKALRQQIEKIIREQLEIALNKVTQRAIKEINAHLDKVLPEILQK
jgi:hypothetical protein